MRRQKGRQRVVVKSASPKNCRDRARILRVRPALLDVNSNSWSEPIVQAFRDGDAFRILFVARRVESIEQVVTFLGQFITPTNAFSACGLKRGQPANLLLKN